MEHCGADSLIGGGGPLTAARLSLHGRARAVDEHANALTRNWALALGISAEHPAAREGRDDPPHGGRRAAVERVVTAAAVEAHRVGAASILSLPASPRIEMRSPRL